MTEIKVDSTAAITQAPEPTTPTAPFNFLLNNKPSKSLANHLSLNNPAFFSLKAATRNRNAFTQRTSSNRAIFPALALTQPLLWTIFATRYNLPAAKMTA